MLGIGTKLLFCEYLTPILLKIFHNLMTYLLCGCEKDEKQEKDIDTEKNTVENTGGMLHTLMIKLCIFIKPHVLTQLVKIIVYNAAQVIPK